MGDRRRSLRAGPAASCRTGSTRDRVRSGRRLLHPGKDQPRSHANSCGYSRGPPAQSCLAPAKRRQRRERPALLRLDLDPPRHRRLLIRHNPTTREPAFYLCRSPTAASLAELVRVAGTRWSVEECFQAAKGQVDLDHYQVRHWTAWHRNVVLATFALAFLAAVTIGIAPA